jgi:hypothetical protein
MTSGPPRANRREIPAECSRQSKVSSQVCETVCTAAAATLNAGRKAAATASTSTAPCVLKARETPLMGHLSSTAWLRPRDEL